MFEIHVLLRTVWKNRVFIYFISIILLKLSVTRSEVNDFDRSGSPTIKDFPRGSDNNDASVLGSPTLVFITTLIIAKIQNPQNSTKEAKF